MHRTSKRGQIYSKLQQYQTELLPQFTRGLFSFFKGGNTPHGSEPSLREVEPFYPLVLLAQVAKSPQPGHHRSAQHLSCHPNSKGILHLLCSYMSGADIYQPFFVGPCRKGSCLQLFREQHPQQSMLSQSRVGPLNISTCPCLHLFSISF